jgi:hypothetical protein
VREINTNADIKVEAEVRREARRVSAVRFLVSDTHQLSLFRDDPLFERLVDFGLTEKQARDALQTHESDYIGDNLAIVEGLLEAGRIKSSLAAATVDALKTDYRKTPARREQRQNERTADAAAERAARQAAALEADRRQALEMEFEARQLDAAIAALSETERQALERAFIAGLEDRSIAGALILLESFRRSGLESAGIRCAFRTFQRDRLMKGQKPDEAAFARFVAEREAA